MPPRSKGKGRSSKRKVPVDDVDEVEEEFDKLAQWDLEAWRRFGYTRYDADVVATRAEALGKHTPAVMMAPKAAGSSSSSLDCSSLSSASSSSLSSSSSSSLASNLYQSFTSNSAALPLVSSIAPYGIAKAPKPNSRSKKTSKHSILALSSTSSVASVFSEPPPEGGLDLATNRQSAI